MILSKLRLRRALTAIALAATGAAAFGQAAFPSKPIQVVVPYAPGGQNDVIVRTLENGLREELGQPIVLISRPGAGTLIGTQFVSRAEPDGHTILLASSSLTVSPPSTQPSTSTC